jgi:hypothetical protein
MALRLRRGTDAERLLITPVEGELIYTTDTKLLYAGDGSTAGGTLVTGSGGGGSTTLDALTDTDLTGASDNDVLTYNSGTSKWESAAVPGVGSIGLNDLSDVFMPSTPSRNEVLRFDGVNFTAYPISRIFNEQQNYKINIVGDDSTIIINTDTNNVTGNFFGNVTGDTAGTHTGGVVGDVTGNTTGLHTGSMDGDVTGSVFGDDSTVLVDGINNTVVGNINNALVLTEQVTVNSSSASSTVISSNAVTAGGNGPNLDFFGSRVSLDSPIVLEPGDSVIDIAVNGWDGAAQTTAAVIKMGPDKYTGSIASGVMPGRIVFLTYNESGATGIDNALVFNRFGNLGIGTDAPAEKLDVRGNIVATGTIQPGVYADATARDTALTAPTAGQMVYITDIAKFQGNTDGTITGWTNLN